MGEVAPLVAARRVCVVCYTFTFFVSYIWLYIVSLRILTDRNSGKRTATFVLLISVIPRSILGRLFRHHSC